MSFSTGARGAVSAEYFLKLGYAVIFLHRQGSLTPYANRCFPSGGGSPSLGDWFAVEGPPEGAPCTTAPLPTLKSEFAQNIHEAVSDYAKYRKFSILLFLRYFSG